MNAQDENERIELPIDATPLVSSNVEITTWIGVLISGDVKGKDIPIFEVKAPCGHVWRCRVGDKIPDHDIPCPCGNPKHWIWKFEHVEKIKS